MIPLVQVPARNSVDRKKADNGSRRRGEASLTVSEFLRIRSRKDPQATALSSSERVGMALDSPSFGGYTRAVRTTVASKTVVYALVHGRQAAPRWSLHKDVLASHAADCSQLSVLPWCASPRCIRLSALSSPLGNSIRVENLPERTRPRLLRKESC